ncbi:PLDc N-terminal domain-containing protein [Pontibacter sp. CAU 1760]
MDIIETSPFVALFIALNYALVIVSLVHLIFRTRYTVTQRLAWMVALWVLPVLGPATYWIYWFRKQ